MDALKIENVSKSIKKHQILNNINLEINSSEALGLVGPNGAGKTSLIKCISGIWKYDKGDIYLCGKNIKINFGYAMKKTGFIIEYPKLFNELTPIQNIEYINAYYDIFLSKEEIKKIVEKVGLKDWKNKKLKTFSSGMYQKICLGVLLARKPEIMILDEPTATLDPKSIIDFRNILIDIKQNLGVTMLISSHNLSEVEKLCDRIAILDKGNILEVKNIKNTNQKKYRIIFENEQDILKASKYLKNNNDNIEFKIEKNNLIISCSIKQFKQFLSNCPYTIKDFVIGDLENEFLSALKEN